MKDTSGGISLDDGNDADAPYLRILHLGLWLLLPADQQQLPAALHQAHG